MEQLRIDFTDNKTTNDVKPKTYRERLLRTLRKSKAIAGMAAAAVSGPVVRTAVGYVEAIVGEAAAVEGAAAAALP